MKKSITKGKYQRTGRGCSYRSTTTSLLCDVEVVAVTRWHINGKFIYCRRLQLDKSCV